MIIMLVTVTIVKQVIMREVPMVKKSKVISIQSDNAILTMAILFLRRTIVLPEKTMEMMIDVTMPPLSITQNTLKVMMWFSKMATVLVIYLRVKYEKGIKF